jgi:hypothetical protein
MKKYLGIAKTAAAAALGLLLLAACANILAPPPRQAAGLAEGKGAVRIETGAGDARTALPEAVFDHYEYLFSKEGDSPLASMTSSGEAPDAVFELEPGNWSVTVKAYVGSEPDTLAAEGSANFTIAVGQETPIEVKLSPTASDGTGTLNYTLRYPATAEVRAFTLTRITADTSADLTGGNPVTDNPFAGSLASASGYYLARASLAKDGITAEKTEVVHIYKNMTTELELEFDDPDFKAIVVASSADSGPGTLRQALIDAQNGVTILINLPEDDRVITLTSGPLQIGTSLTIEGNGATVTQSGFTAANNSQLLRVGGGTTTFVYIRRIHFTGGRGLASGAAVYNSGAKLFLESCIFSDNRATNGGAVFAESSIINSLAVRGCTFYGNTAVNQGGAISFSGGKSALLLDGNVFWANTAATDPAVYVASSRNTPGSFTNAASQPVTLVSFRPLTGGPALGALAARPEVYPETDFYGDPIPETDVAAGAAQIPAQGSGYVLDYGAIGAGEVAIISGPPDEDGLYSDSVTLSASNGSFGYWIVNGIQDGESSNTLVVPMTGHTIVRAKFFLEVTSAANDGPGTLREALTNADAGDTIVFRLPAEEKTITLTAVLPGIAQKIDIEGNGATLTQRGIVPSTDTQFFRITTTAGDLRVSRLHFKGGRTTGYGGAIYNEQGKLTLESCIFSDNVDTSTSTGRGSGAICNRNNASLTVYGCTFYGNTTASQGGAIYKTGSDAFNLIGNVFWGNTAASYPVLGGTPTLTVQGFNVSDKEGGTSATQSGWNFATGDKQAMSLPFSFATFRPIGGAGLENVITTRPSGYPKTDFYGDPIPEENAAAGAAQIPTATGNSFVLDYAAVGAGELSASGATVDADGLTPAGSNVILTAQASAGARFAYWTVDGAKDGEQSPELTVAMNAHKTVRAVFSTIHTINTLDSGPGSLREALDKAVSEDTIVFPAGQTITLFTPLSSIRKSLVIEGNGATLTQRGFIPASQSQLLNFIQGAAASISRLHFKGGRATGQGGAIRSSQSNLTLESCIFSDNVTTNTGATGGGAIWSGNGTLSVSGCTFYKNTGGEGGAIYYNQGSGAIAGGPLTLTGNVFLGNTATTSPVVGVATNSTVISGGHNVSDTAGGTGSSQSGWQFETGDNADIYAGASPFLSSVSFRPFSGGAALNAITTLPSGYPEEDFYGDPIQTPAAAGAAQTAVQGTGYILNYAAVGAGAVVASGGTVNEDGLSPASSEVTLTATPLSYGVFEYWTVDGAMQADPSPVLTVTMDKDKTVRAVFSFSFTVTSSLDDGPGTLREALTYVYDGGVVILPAGQTITLSTPLPAITHSIVVEGNGATLTQDGFTPDTNTQLLRISESAAVVRISRLRFDRGRATNSGGAIDNRGSLTLESCVFIDNQTSAATAYGGAVYTAGSSLTVSGCTFYGNAAGTTGGRGGAICGISGTLTIAGNIFWENTAATNGPVYGSPTPTTKGYNVSDKAGGAGASASGWTFKTGDAKDVYLTNLGMNTEFMPFSTELPAVPSSLEGFPTKYFNGEERGTYSTSGAMPADDYGTDPNPGPGPEPITPPAKPQDFSEPPSQAAGLSSSPGMRKIYLSWFPTARAEKYEVYYSVGTNFAGATKWGEEPTEPKATITGLADSTVYNFWVKAKNPSGEGALSRMFTATKRTSDPVPSAFLINGTSPSIFSAGDFYTFRDRGEDMEIDERYYFSYSGPFPGEGNSIKYVCYFGSENRGVIIYNYDNPPSADRVFQATYYWNLDTSYPPKSVMGQANGYGSNMGNNQETATLEEAIAKFAYEGGLGQEGGRYEYISEMEIYYKFVEE